jgi:hypothetical protein
MPTIVEGVDFDVIAREWRFKWSADDDKVRQTDRRTGSRVYTACSLDLEILCTRHHLSHRSRVHKGPIHTHTLPQPAVSHTISRCGVAQASLAAAQKLLQEHLATVKAVDGVQSVQRVVCGGCLDFKVVTAVSADKYGDWEAAGHAPEAAFLEAAKAIPGVTTVSGFRCSAPRRLSMMRLSMMRLLCLLVRSKRRPTP